MNCERAREILPLHLCGELRGEEMADLQLHLEECKQCAMAVQRDMELDSALRAAMLEQGPDVSAVLDRVHERIVAPWWKRMPQLVPVHMVAAAALALALIALPLLYVHQMRQSMALAAVDDHYSDLVMLRHPDWEHKPEDVTRFLQQQFPQKRNLLPSITPEGAAFEKVRLCNLRGTTYAHFVFRTGTVETSVFLQANSDGPNRYQAVALKNSEHGLDVAGFSSGRLTGIVVGQHDLVPTLKIADQLSKTL